MWNKLLSVLMIVMLASAAGCTSTTRYRVYDAQMRSVEDDSCDPDRVPRGQHCEDHEHVSGGKVVAGGLLVGALAYVALMAAVASAFQGYGAHSGGD